MSDLWIELNIALLPAEDLAGKLTALSGEFTDRYRTIVRLGEPGSRLTLAPHLTLYQVPVPLAGLTRLHTGLSDIARTARSGELLCKGLAYNAGEASLEARTDIPGELVSLQRAVIALANPIREGRLLERDPAGNRVGDLSELDNAVGRNIRDTGYAEVGDLFRPHYTLNWCEPGTPVEAGELGNAIDPAALTGRYSALGMFVLGPYGTCPQLLARYELGG